MSKAKLKVTEDGRLVLDQPALTEICFEINALQCELKEIAESIRTLNDSMRHLVTQQLQQREAQAAIAAALLIDQDSGASVTALKYRADMLTKAFGV